MDSAGIRELKNHLSRYLRRVRAGEPIAVTEHGRVIAELRPPSGATHAVDPYEALVAQGVLRPPLEQGDPLADWPDESLRLAPGTAAALIDEDRGA